MSRRRRFPPIVHDAFLTRKFQEYSKKSADIAAQRRRDFERLSTAEQASKRDEAKERVERIQRRRKKLERRAVRSTRLPQVAFGLFGRIQ